MTAPAQGGTSRPPASPLRRGYLVQNPWWRAWLRAADLTLSLRRRTPRPQTRPTPRRVLVGVGGHLGDAVIATRAIGELSRALPDAEIGVVSGSWNRSILVGHPQVRWVHAIDHWKATRAPRSLADRWFHYRRTRAEALREIRGCGYDTAVDLYAHYPNFAAVLADAAIPVRVGFATGGYGALYTDVVEWTPGRHVSDDHRDALRALVPDLVWDDRSTYELAPVAESERSRWTERLDRHRLRPGAFAVVHTGAGAAIKEWMPEGWAEVARDLMKEGLGVVVTGAGAREQVMAAAIARDAPGVVNLCGELSLDELRCAIASSAGVLTVDTVTMHLAVAAGKPCVAIVSGIDAPGRWATDAVRALTHPTPCAPCFRSRGCADMSCVRGVTGNEVLRATHDALPTRAP